MLHRSRAAAKCSAVRASREHSPPVRQLSCSAQKLGTQAPQQPASLVEFIQKPAEHVASKTGRRRPCAGGVSAKRAGAGHVPAAFLCPLSKEVMSEPVTLVESGVTYQRDVIVAWFAE